MVTLPSTIHDIGEQLSQQHALQKLRNRQALYQILSSIKFLCRQGIALRGDGNESDGNFQRLLRMKADISPDIQNEVIKVVGLKILREITSECQDPPFITVMADETTDSSRSKLL